MLQKLKHYTNIVLNRKSKLDLDNDGKINSYREEIQGVFSQFRLMYDKLGEVNGELSKVIDDETNIAEQSKKRIEIAQKDLETNSKLQKKVEDFIL